ncbi:MAG: HAD family phosphatase [Nitrospiraceae bacterium]|nr:HAD family phosphatase [Nitrospiraceae bacterium]
MISARPATALFLDIGGVLLENGWDHGKRRRAAELFGFDFEETDARHHLTFGVYELGKISLDEYLSRAVFYKKRPFTRREFKSFMLRTSAFPEMLELVRTLKRAYGLKTAAISNEGRELTIHRIKEFNLDSFVDFFVSSCFVRLRKPDEDMFQLALDLAQVPAADAIYIDDREMFVEVARLMGMKGIHHKGYESTLKELESAGLVPEEAGKQVS